MRRVAPFGGGDPAVGVRLAEVLQEVTEGSLGSRLSAFGDPLRELGISSRSMIAFLVAVEDEFDFQWDVDTPEDVFLSIETIAVHIEEEGLVPEQR